MRQRVKIAYLINQYPHPSHTFIRREIASLEALGIYIARFSLRRMSGLVDAQDEAEQARTRAILDAGPFGLAFALLETMAVRPRHFFRGLWLALRMGWRSRRSVARHVIYLAEAAVLRAILAREQYPHLHAHFGMHSTTIAMLCRELGGPPYSFTVHGPEEFDDVRELGLAEKIGRAAFVVAVSHYGRSQLCRWTPLEEWNKLFIVRCGVDAAFFATSSPCPRDPRFVCVARLSPQKAHFVLLEAVHCLKAEAIPFELVLIGDGPLRPAIEKRIRTLGLEACVSVKGWLDEYHVRQAIAGSRLMVLPSFAEGLPVVLMEALAMGRPVITTYISGIPELVEDERNGWLVPPGSVEALADALRTALKAPTALLDEMGQRGAARVNEVHDCMKEARKLANLFGAAVGVPEDRPLASVATAQRQPQTE
jgi:glycosyltransferase involved in cell wall biosynthesis